MKTETSILTVQECLDAIEEAKRLAKQRREEAVYFNVMLGNKRERLVLIGAFEMLFNKAKPDDKIKVKLVMDGFGKDVGMDVFRFECVRLKIDKWFACWPPYGESKKYRCDLTGTEFEMTRDEWLGAKEEESKYRIV